MLGCLACAPATASAQVPIQSRDSCRASRDVFTNLYGPHGLVVDSEATLPGEQSHSAHFNSDFQSNFSQFGTALVSQLVTVPMPSPASGFTYELDQTDRRLPPQHGKLRTDSRGTL